MVSTANYRPWLIGGWLMTLAVIVTVSMAMDANRSTTWLLLALGMAPALVMALLRGGAASPTVAEILHSVDAKNGRP
jgi:hypothetical protein